jgi:hypothetical protein
MDSNTLRRVPDKHGNLQRNRAALDELEGILTARQIRVRAPDAIDPRVRIPEFAIAGQPVPIEITLATDDRLSCRITITNESDRLMEARVVTPPHQTTIDDLPPGAYTIDVAGLVPAAPITPISSTTVILDGAHSAA